MKNAIKFIVISIITIVLHNFYFEYCLEIDVNKFISYCATLGILIYDILLLFSIIKFVKSLITTLK
jgi:hypothetical protein